jgi:hypothetical protein
VERAQTSDVSRENDETEEGMKHIVLIAGALIFASAGIRPDHDDYDNDNR